MNGESWWISDEGVAYRNLLRNITAARGRIQVTAKAKGGKGAYRERALLLDAARKWRDTFGASWPRPRAEVALDVWAITRSAPPQPQNFAKRLLDQLGDVDGQPIVYTDDRQVTMLFVRVDQIISDTIPPTVFFSAQRASLVRESIRFASDHDADPLKDDEWELRVDWQGKLDDAAQSIETWRLSDSEAARKFFLPRAVYKHQHLEQRYALWGVDCLAAQIVATHANLRPGDPIQAAQITTTLLDNLASMPYALALGVLPVKSGESEQFRARLRAAINQRISQNPTLYPLLCGVGLTIFCCPGRQGKDLDNIFRLIMPPLLERLRPPQAGKDDPDTMNDNQFRLWDDVRRGTATPPESRIAFIEAVVLKGLTYPAGTVIITLSDGRRHESWWKLTILDAQ